MKELPILFRGPMVRAILEDRKTQTRRIVKDQRDMEFDIDDPHYGPYWLSYATDADGEDARVRCPYGEPGGRLWVRETWRTLNTYDHLSPRELVDAKVSYDADTGRTQPSLLWGKRRPSIFMPRWASRITLEITGVRVEWLQAISGPDCWEEGISHAGWDPERYGSVVECYRDIWQSIHGPGSWGANPRVWVIEFRRVTTLTPPHP